MGNKNRNAETIGVINQKGGVGKSTYAHTIARELAKKSKVLLIDSDGQATLTELIDLYSHYDKEFLDDYLAKNSVDNIFKRTTIEPIDITSIINTTENGDKINELHFLASPGIELFFNAESSGGGKDLLLKNYIKKIKKNYDYIVIDALPGVSTLFNNILLASDSLLIPIQTKSNSIAGANSFIEVIDTIMGDFGTEYNNIFILPTMFNKQRADDKAVLSEIKTDYKDFIASCEFIGESNLVILPEIPERSVFSNAQAVRHFVQDYIEYFDTGKRDILLLLEKITKIIKKTTKKAK